MFMSLGMPSLHAVVDGLGSPIRESKMSLDKRISLKKLSGFPWGKDTGQQKQGNHNRRTPKQKMESLHNLGLHYECSVVPTLQIVNDITSKLLVQIK